ncbi:MAG: EAL domain-containing protein [Candidatus Thiodiazotropha sp. (ex Dulcina madagascariensis)]|nr:EAL domain-containing protein [Candidatus Thiodiazotropha sp. (ex Dulcina madagascariensis)]MCU7924829.1 EAL domain-containing protein [Candidatus Thiodiazotropha sp. (ex Dulcina madagascariensis)]
MYRELKKFFTRLFILLWLTACLFCAPSLAGDPPVNSASELDYPPFSIVLDDGAASGLSVELMREALKAMGREVTFEVRPWSEIKQDLARGRLEALPLVGRTPEREALFDFTVPYISLFGAVFVRANENDINRVEDLLDRRVGVLRGDNAEEFMRREKISNRLIASSSYEEALQALSKGELDAVVAQRLVGLNLIHKLKIDNLKTAIAPLKGLRQDFSFAVTEGNKELLSQLNEGLSIVIADGTYDRLRSKWLGAFDWEAERNRHFWMMVTSTSACLSLILLGLYLRQFWLAHQNLKASEQRYHSVVDNIKEVIFQVDGQGQLSFLNPAWCEITGFPVEESLDTPFLDFVHPDDRQGIAGLFGAQTQHKRSDSQYEIRCLHKEKDFRLVEIYARPTLDRADTVVGISGTLIDITDRKQAEEKLHLAANVFTHAREGITITDAEGTIIEVNEAFTQVTGYSREEVLGRNPRILKSDRHDAVFYAALWRNLIEKGHWNGEIWNRRKNGEVYAELLTISAVRDSQGETQHYVALFSDISTQKAQQQQLEHIAHYDALTGLPNRVLLADRLNQAMHLTQRRGHRLAVAYLDLDGFKAINDSYGHEVGDQLLITIATRMGLSLRESDTVARLGGDEFVAVLVDVADDQDRMPLLHRLLASSAQPIQIGSLELQISASLGVTFYPQADAVDADQLLRQADQAMYQAKLAGKNRIHVFDNELDRALKGRHESLEDINRALSDREFELHYQPKVNMRTGEVIGAEALIRWRHPQRGMLLPSEFLPMIEDHPISVALGEWVIDSALTQLEAWRSMGLNTLVSVNVSAHQLQQENFINRLHQLLAAHPRVESTDLELEVLETSALEDLAQVSRVMQACSDIGVRFALDDFGTGYSSLTYLKRLPAALLKIDKSFVRNMLDDPEDLAILEGVLGLARAFRRQAIAEGVESEDHGEMLLQLGCELAQGYAISRPMPASELPDWIDGWRPSPLWTVQRPVSPRELPLLFASVEHRAWVGDVTSYLNGEGSSQPTLDPNQCRFSHWLTGEGKIHHGSHPAFQDIEILHRQVHTLAWELLQQQARQRNPVAPAKLNQLYTLRDTLLGRIKVLVHEVQT